MSATRRFLSPFLITAFALSARAGAQVPMVLGSWNAGIVAGASVPTGHTGDVYYGGWTAGAWLAYHSVGASLSARAMYSYQRFQGAVSTTPDLSINGFSGEVIGHLPSLYIRPYLVGGIGAYHVSDEGTHFGWHAGGGFAFNFVSHTMLLEAKYLAIGTGATEFHTIPITLGLVF